MPWNQLGIHLVSLSQKVMPVMGDNFCFLNTIDLVLYCDYDEIVTVDHMVNNILDHLATNAEYYKQFNTGDLIWNAEGYFKFGKYCGIIINVIIIAIKSTTPESCQSIRKGQMEIYRL